MANTLKNIIKITKQKDLVLFFCEIDKEKRWNKAQRFISILIYKKLLAAVYCLNSIQYFFLNIVLSFSFTKNFIMNDKSLKWYLQRNISLKRNIRKSFKIKFNRKPKNQFVSILVLTFSKNQLQLHQFFEKSSSKFLVVYLVYVKL